VTGSDVAVVIPTRERWDVLARTLDGLRRQSIGGFEVIVVVDGTDQRPPAVDDVRVIVKEHGGPGAARNAGARVTERPLVLFLGDDMVPTAQLVELHLSAHRRHPQDHVAVLGQARWHPDVASGAIHGWMDRTGTQFDFDGITGEDAGFGRFYSCNVSLKRSFFLLAGGFDERFDYYYEDLDCGYRLREKGMRLVYEPGALTYHLHRYDLPALERRFVGVGAGEHRMARKHPWFEPFFLRRFQEALAQPEPRRTWAAMAHRLPPGTPGRLRHLAEARSDLWFHRHLAAAFLQGWAAGEDLADLEEYLGERYDRRLLEGHRRAVDAERERAPDEATFYRTSETYLYDLTAFAMSGIKAPYHAELRAVLPPGATVLDVGCGIGADGIRLMASGYRVAFADFDNPSTAFLRWRLERRGIDAPVFDLDRDEVPGGFDAVMAFDVIEHVEDPWAFLADLERRGGLVAVNFLEPDPHDTDLHHALPIGALLDHAARQGLVRYRRYHGRSHLVLYRPGVSQRRRTQAWWERRAGGHLRGRAAWYPVPAR